MTESFPLGTQQFRDIRNRQDWQRTVRRFEVDSIFAKFADCRFEQALELGCGSGQNSRFLAAYCEHLTATEFDAGKLTEENGDGVTFMVADAQDLSAFATNSMDLVFSSNLIEHLPDVGRCLEECRRVVKPDGIIVHTVPNNVWKMFHLLLFYPAVVRQGIRRILSREWEQGRECNDQSVRLDDNMRPRVSRMSLTRLFPKIHGISRTHLGEFARWRDSIWKRTFRRNRLDVVRQIRLPFYFGHGYDFPRLLKLGNYLRLSATTAYVLKDNAVARTGIKWHVRPSACESEVRYE